MTGLGATCWPKCPRTFPCTVHSRSTQLGTCPLGAAIRARLRVPIGGRVGVWAPYPQDWRLIRRYRPDVIWSTYPIATAHRIALTLHKLSGVPLVMDFRDPMAQEGYPADARTWRSFERIEQEAVRHASKLVFVTPGCQRLYRERYAHVDSERFALIENGFDEEAFVDAERDRTSDALNPGRLTILHSGIVYPVRARSECSV